MQTNGGLSQTDERRVPRETIDGVSTNGNESPTQRELLTLPVARMKGVGAARAELMAKLGIRRAYDLLFNFPRDYLEVVLRRDATALTDDAVQSIAGEIIDFSVRYTRRGTLVTLNVDVKKDVVQALWFNMPYIANSFRQGRPLILTGKPKKKQGFWQFSHPKLTYLDSGLDIPWNMDGAEGEIEEKFVLPVYSLTEGLSQAQLQRVVRGALETLPDYLPEALPEDLRQKRALAPIAEAIRLIHYPSSPEEAEYARRRFAYQELLVLQLALALCRARRRVNLKAPELPGSAKIDSRIRRLFPFELTPAQNGAIAEIAADLGRPVPMNRLLQGDVGSGKTVVALYAVLQAVANGAQAVVMAPTETLARQHLRTIDGFLRGTATTVVPFFGAQKASERADILSKIEAGRAQIVVGTQALICNTLKFKKLGLVVIDEQHKFGVRQRASLKNTDSDLEPHYLVMSATPIPRSMTMTFFGDLDVSVMRGAPPGRTAPTTSIVTAKTFESWMNFVCARLDEGRQAYFVVPRVDDDGTEGGSASGDEERALFDAPEYDASTSFSRPYGATGAWTRWNEIEEPETGFDFESSSPTGRRAATKESASREKPALKTVGSVFRELSEGFLKKYRVGVLHGRMTTLEKESTMRNFRDGKLQCLVATTVIEVGVDVPEATLMTIFNAERFGLAQLHQLRGRVTRGKYPGFCAVIPTEGAVPDKKKPASPAKKGRKSSRDPNSAETAQKETLDRLRFFCESTDGFELAEHDFELRGPGELLGSKQHGSVDSLRIANLSRDFRLLQDARGDADEMIRNDPGLLESEHALLRKQVLSRYGRALDLGDVG